MTTAMSPSPGVTPPGDISFMTTTTAATTAPEDHLPLPAGAVWFGEWEGEGDDRDRFFNHTTIEVDDASLTIQGVQYVRGATGRSILLRLDPAIAANGADFTPRSARQLAAMLQNLADTCEILDEVNR